MNWKTYGYFLGCSVLTLAFTLPISAQQYSDRPSGNEELFNEIDEDLGSLVTMSEGSSSETADLHREVSSEGRGPWAPGRATHPDNPLLDRECHEQAMRRALDEMKHHEGLAEQQARNMARMHMEEQLADYEDGISYAEYVEHLAGCDAFCGPMVESLIGCHVEAISDLGPELVFFDLNRYDVTDLADRQTIDAMAERLRRNPDKSVLLIGRASRIGDLGYNRRLSHRRARAVGDELAARGISTERIKILFFGYEPPQISEWIASKYGVGDLWVRRGVNPMNQSVLMVAY